MGSPEDTGAPAASQRHCYAVIFSSQLVSPAPEGYEEAAAEMVALAKEQPGFLDVESARSPDGFGITVSYWDSLDAVAAFKAQEAHRRAQERGRRAFYSRYEVRVCRVERRYGCRST